MNVWVAVMATVAIMFLVVIPAGGVLLFRPQRARNVKHAEREMAVQRHVTEIAVYHPEIVRKPRIDRHPFYIGPLVGVWGYAWCIFLGAPITSNVAALSNTTRYTMAGCYFIGSTLILSASAMGGRIGRRRFRPRIHDHPTCAVLGDDVTMPYWLGCAGLGTVAVSMAIYSSTSFKSTTGSLGGWLTATMAVSCAFLLPMFIARVRRFERDNAALVKDALARMSERDDLD